MDSSNLVINSFWGGKLNETGRISINSFKSHGHKLHLWSYDGLGKDASQIVPVEVWHRWFPEGDLSDYRKTKLPTFACYFRYKLLYEIGGWWCDLDTICLKPFDFPQEYVFCGQYFGLKENEIKEKGLRIITGTFKVPKRCDMLGRILSDIERDAIDGNDPGWGVWGPRMFTRYVKECGLLGYKTRCNVFAPFPPGESGFQKQYVDTNVFVPEWAYALHFFNRYTMDKTGLPGSLYDIYHKKHLSLGLVL
jgi:hypothetical protein